MASSLQTLAFIQVVDNLLKKFRIPETGEESMLLSYYHEMNELLKDIFHNSEIVLFWNMEEIKTLDKIRMRKKLLQNLDLSFHILYRKLMESFQKVQEVFLQISPGMQKLYVYSVPSVKDLVELYMKKTSTLQKLIYRDDLVEDE